MERAVLGWLLLLYLLLLLLCCESHDVCVGSCKGYAYGFTVLRLCTSMHKRAKHTGSRPSRSAAEAVWPSQACRHV